MDPSTSSLQLNVSSPISPPPKWTELQCDTVEQIVEAQSLANWHQVDGLLFLSLYTIICSFGAAANLFVLLVFARSSTLRNVRNSFIVNLAFSDLLLCTLTAPATLYSVVNLFWPLGNLSCQILASVQALNTFVSSLTLAAIALDRVLLTVAPFRWRMSSTAPLISYALLWFISLLVALPYATAVHAAPVYSFEPWSDPAFDHVLTACHRSRPVICMERSTSWESAPISKLSYTLTVLAIQYLLPLFALAFAYTQIGSTIRKRGKTSTTVDESRRTTMQTRNRKALVLLVILVGTYAIAWAPVNIYNVLSGFDFIQFSQYRYLFCHLLGISSACINPLTYALVNDSFRDAASLLVCSRTRPSNGQSSTGHTKRTHFMRRGEEENKKDCIFIPSHAHSLL